MNLRPQCTVECHWRNNFWHQVCSQWASSGLPVCCNYASQHRIATGTPLDASISQCGSSVVCPVVFQCTDSIWYRGHMVRSLPSMQPLVYTTCMKKVVCAKLISFELQPQIHQNCNGAHIQGLHRVILKNLHVWRAEFVCIAEQHTSSKSWIYKDLSTCYLVSRHLVISNWHGCYSA